MKNLSKSILAAEKNLTSLSAKIDRLWFRAPLDLVREQAAYLMSGEAFESQYAIAWLDNANTALVNRRRAIVKAGATAEMMAVIKILDALVIAHMNAEFAQASMERSVNVEATAA